MTDRRPSPQNGRVAMTVITRVSDPTPDQLGACLRSVSSQRLPRAAGWCEHVVIDTSQDRDVVDVLDRAAAGGSIVLARHEHHSSPAAALNAAIARASGEFVMVVGHDDVLAPGAVTALLDAAMRDGRVGGRGRHGARESSPRGGGPVDVVYADHDHIRACATESGATLTDRFVLASRKPAWSPERLRTQDYVGAPVAIRRTLFDDVGGFHLEFDGALEHDLLLRLGERARRIVHVPEILLHRRMAHDVSPLASTAIDATRRAVDDHCRRIGLDVRVTARVVTSPPSVGDGGGLACSVVPEPVRPQPLVSVVIPTNGSTGEVWGVERCFVTEAVRSLADRSLHRELEFVVVADASTPDAVVHALRDIAGERLTLVGYDRPFNFADKIDVGVAAASGDLILMLNDDTELIEPASVTRLVATVLGPAEGAGGRWGDVAMAGARLLFDDATLQHGGVVFNQFADHACRGWPGDSDGPAPSFPLAGARECSAVTAAAALVRRDVFEEVGAMNTALPLNFNDVDLCARIRARGHRIVYRPDASWYHFESRTRVARVLDSETAYMDEHWHSELRNDPYHHPVLIPAHFDWREADTDVEPAGRAPGVFSDAIRRNLSSRSIGVRPRSNDR